MEEKNQMKQNENAANQRSLTIEELTRIAELCDKYRYLHEKEQRLYERLTICGTAISASRGLNPQSKERVMCVYANAKAECRRLRAVLQKCRKRLLLYVQADGRLSPDEKQTLLLRIGQDRTIREIARICGKSDAAIVKRIKRCGYKLSGDEQCAEVFYNCMSRMQQLRKEDA